jgi:hypothetical protein
MATACTRPKQLKDAADQSRSNWDGTRFGGTDEHRPPRAGCETVTSSPRRPLGPFAHGAHQERKLARLRAFAVVRPPFYRRFQRGSGGARLTNYPGA